MPIPTGYPPGMIEEYTRAGYWGTKVLADYLAQNAARRPDKVAYVQGDRRITWGEYSRLADRLALAFLEMGVRKEDRFGVYLPDWIEVHLCYDALSRVGAVPVAMNIGVRAREVEYMLQLTEAVGVVTPGAWRGFDYAGMMSELRPRLPGLRHHIVVGDSQAPGARPFTELTQRTLEEKRPSGYLDQFRPGANEVFIMNFSSGTTGLPKCIPHTINRWLYFVKLAIEGGNITSEDVLLSLVPNNSGFGLWTSHICPIMLGTTTVLLERFDADQALRLIEKEQATMATAVSTQFIKMLEVPDLFQYDLSSWRIMYTGGQDVPYEKVKELESKTRCTVLQFYGSLESGGITRTRLGETLEQRSRTVGKPIPEMNVRLIDPNTGEDVTGTGRPGEVACKGPTMGGGYYKDAEANRKLFTRDGWMLVGDLAVIGEDGYMRLVGRVKDIIIRGGQNISAAEVEDAIFAHPKVADVAVVAMPDPVFGEKACAYVVPKPGQGITFKELIDFLLSRNMAKYKLPERLELVKELPLSPGGKVTKNVLREDIARKLKAESGARA